MAQQPNAQLLPANLWDVMDSMDFVRYFVDYAAYEYSEENLTLILATLAYQNKFKLKMGNVLWKNFPLDSFDNGYYQNGDYNKGNLFGDLKLLNNCGNSRQNWYKAIHSNWIDENSPKQVNLGHELNMKLIAFYDKVKANQVKDSDYDKLWDKGEIIWEAQSTCFTLLSENTYDRWKKKLVEEKKSQRWNNKNFIGYEDEIDIWIKHFDTKQPLEKEDRAVIAQYIALRKKKSSRY